MNVGTKPREPGVDGPAPGDGPARDRKPDAEGGDRLARHGLLSPVLLTVLATALTVGSVEIGARAWLAFVADEDAFARYATFAQLRERHPLRLQPHRYLGYVTTPSYTRGANRHDRHGFRGAEIADPKPAGELRIVCIGGSTTYTPKVEDWRLSYPALLEVELRKHDPAVRVVNAGVPGWSSFESLLNLPLRVLDLIAALARSRGARPIFATFATSEAFDLPRVTSPEYRRAHRETNAAVLSLGRRIGVPVFDFASVMPDDAHLWTYGRHVTEEGARLKARLFADFLISAGALGPKTAPDTGA